MKMILVISLFLLSLQANHQNCFKKADKMILKHVEFNILTFADIRPQEFEILFDNKLYTNIIEDSIYINKFLCLLNKLEKVQTIDSIANIDTRAKIEIYKADKVCNIYLDRFVVLINGIEYKNTPELRAEFEKLQDKPIDD